MNKMGLSEMITYSTVLIHCKYNNGTEGSGTGFIINLCHNKDTDRCIPVLITNSHVVDNSIETKFEFCRSDNDGNPIDTESFSFVYTGNTWIHHPDKNIDLCCLLLGEMLNQIQGADIKIFYIPIETDIIPNQEQLKGLSAMEEVVMIGYPIGISDKYNHKPIIRRGITASHPGKDYQGKKESLLDMPCYPGSSGSPVFILNQGTYQTQNGFFIGDRIYFLGVLYGGPQFDAHGILQFAALPNFPTFVTRIPINLGIMIKSEKILEFENMFRSIEENE